MMQAQQEVVLCKVAEQLSAANILWALGGSMLLCKNGIVDHSDDIDLILAPEDAPRADAILSSLGKKYPRVPTPSYATQFFHRYDIDGVHLTIISGLTLHYKGFLYRYQFDRDAIVSMQPVGHVYVPCTALEDWWVLYQMMPDRAERFLALDKYMSSHGVRYPERFGKLRRQPLPPAVLAGIRRLGSLAPRQPYAVTC
ncbi:MAG: hypothetical protein EOM63_02715 [Clostridia bacterium]|nr:hypothetical protein [Clostridia bacterium]